MIKLAAKVVDIACLPLYLFAVASDSASNLRGIIGDHAYLKGFETGYEAARRDFKDA